MDKIINMTPHDIVVDDGVNKKVYPPCGEVARVNLDEIYAYDVDGFKCVKHGVAGNNLPAEEAGVFLIVSSMVLTHLRKTSTTLGTERYDLLAPDTNNAVRNEKGHIISVPGFVIN